MSGTRPQSHLALALATLALCLAVWWAFDSLTGLDPVQDGTLGSTLGTYSPFDEPPPEDGSQGGLDATGLPPLRTADAPPLVPLEPELQPPVQPVETTRAPRVSEDLLPPEDEPEEEPREPEAFFSGSRPTRLLGGVARVNARATEEVLIPRSRAVVGSPGLWVANLGSQRSAVPYVALPMEAPRHDVELPNYYIDRFEVTNARYWEFLQDTASILYRTARQPARNLVEVAQALIREPARNREFWDVTARQLFVANLGVLAEVFQQEFVFDESKTLDVEVTFQRIKDIDLPRGVDLQFYDRAPPGTWPDDRYEERESDHPVRSITVEDAQAFALYHGRHVPTEFEWEVACRGTSGADWPWGSDGSRFDDVVNGGRVRDNNEPPRTVSVFQLEGGASPTGVFQTLGNVSEWTSSFLDAYPGGVRSITGSPERHVVVRGGSAADNERYVVRPAFRGWLADDPDGAPRPRQRRRFTGFRTARYPRRVESVLPTMTYRARVGGLLDPACLQTDAWTGTQGVHTRRFRHEYGESEESVLAWPRPGTKSVVVQPFTSVCLLVGRQWQPNVDPAVSTLPQVLGHPTPVLYGLLHTDLHLPDAWQALQGDTPPWPFPGRVRRATVPPGTYLIASIDGVQALLTSDGGTAWYLGNRPAAPSELAVIERKYGAVGPRPEAEKMRARGAEHLTVRFKVPMHATPEANMAASLTLDLGLSRTENRSLREIAFEYEGK
ncbi:MAG: SUMF1/EgtB/PvdO family nonheme iron enzyme [Planctomycetota bacterium]|nr:SUMF1/EgtB/PvdO family nonheme iron enzyme [Planctomycetota bacterium]